MKARRFGQILMFSACFLVYWKHVSHATASISCSGIDSDSAVEMILGAGPVPNILDVVVSKGARVIGTRAQEGVELGNIAKSHSDGRLMQIEVIDDQATKRLLEVRILRVTGEEWGDFQIGYLQIEQEVPVAIRCEGP